MKAGQRFGRLVAIRSVSELSWLMKCDCGQEKRINKSNLSGKRGTKSCGCLFLEAIRSTGNKNKTHGLSASRIFGIHAGMMKRCYLKSHQAYYRYGGRGIKVCKPWHTFERFFSDMGHPPSADYSLERIDTNGNYEPANCRWATRKEQALNRRNNVYLEFNGERLLLVEWAKRLNVSHELLRDRLRSGWPIEKILNNPKYPYHSTWAFCKRGHERIPANLWGKTCKLCRAERLSKLDK